MRYEVKEAIKTFKSCIDTLNKDKDMLIELYEETKEQEKKVKSITGLDLYLHGNLMMDIVISYLDKKHFYQRKLGQVLEVDRDIERGLDCLTYVPSDIDCLIKQLKEGINELIILEKNRCEDVLSKDEINNIIADLDRKELADMKSV